MGGSRGGGQGPESPWKVKLVSMWNKQLDPLGKSGTLWNLGKLYIVFFEINHFIAVK